VSEVTVALPRCLMRELVSRGLANLAGVRKVPADADLERPVVPIDHERPERREPSRQHNGAVVEAVDDAPGARLLVPSKIEDLGRSHRCDCRRTVR